MPPGVEGATAALMRLMAPPKQASPGFGAALGKSIGSGAGLAATLTERRKAASEFVAAQVQNRARVERCQFRWDGVVQMIMPKPQLRKVCELTEL